MERTFFNKKEAKMLLGVKVEAVPIQLLIRKKIMIK